MGIQYHYETLNGLRFIINTNTDAPNMRPVLKDIYANIYVKHIVQSIGKTWWYNKTPRFCGSIRKLY